jgi:O-antigen/teichoic acid export membrane protein
MISYILVRRTGVPLPIWGAVAASYICSGVVASYKSWRDRLLGAPAPLREIRPILKDFAPTATFTFFTIFSAWSDRWIAGTQLGPSAMGSYAAAVVVIQAVLRVPSHIAYLLVPASTRVALRGAGKSEKFNTAVIGAFSSFLALMTVVILLAPATIVSMLFGPGFLLAAPALFIMSASLMASAIIIPFVSALTGSTRNRLIIWLMGLTFLPRILLLLFFTRRWSLLGTAFATVLADGLLALCCILLARKIGMSFPLRALVRSCTFGAIAFLVGLGALLLNAPQLVAVGLAIAVFIPALWQVVRSFQTSADDERWPGSLSAKTSADLL